MEFISVDKFKEQSKEIQEILNDWAINRLSKYDLISIRQYVTQDKKVLTISEDSIGYSIEKGNRKLTSERIVTYDRYLKDKGIDDIVADTLYSVTRKIEYEIIPLLTEGQLRKFIEDKTKHKIKILYYDEDSSVTNKGYVLHLVKGLKSPTYWCKNLGEDLLEAYWKVACDVANGAISKMEF